MDKKVQIMNIIYAAKYESVTLEEAAKDILSLFSVGSSLMVKKTKIKDWDKLDQCKGLLKNNIFNIDKRVKGEWELIEYIEDFDKRSFIKNRGVGEKSWNEFVELRGY